MFVLADLARITELKPRTLQLWADAGVLIVDEGTDRQGSGKHRTFSRQEATIACLIAPLASQKMTIGGLLLVSKAIREEFAQSRGSDLFQQMIEEATEGNGNHLLVVGTRLDYSSDTAVVGVNYVSSLMEGWETLLTRSVTATKYLVSIEGRPEMIKAKFSYQVVPMTSYLPALKSYE